MGCSRPSSSRSLYECHHRIGYTAVLSLPEPNGHGDVSEFDRMVAGDVPADRSVAANGQIIERQQILTTHKPGSPGEARRAARILDDLASASRTKP